MNTINNITNMLFTEFSKMGKTVIVHAENNILYIKSGNSDTRILNWEQVSLESILDTARSLVLKENYKGKQMLFG
jgi:hypothetical protein